MKRSVLLNWLPFENTATGAAKRAIELHGRLAGEFHLTAAVTKGFPAEIAPEVLKKCAAETRSLKVRFKERSARFWELVGKPDIWATDTLPVPRFKGRVKTVLTVHDLRFLESRDYLSFERYLFLKLNMKAGLKRADAVVTVSEWIAEQITLNYGISPAKLHIIPNAAATLPLAESSSDIGRKYILSVGHLEPRKDHKTLIRSFALIADKWDGDLVVAGRGALLGDLETLANELGIASRVKFNGGVSDSDLSVLYACSTCLVCPSVYEGFGMTLLEGLEAGLPVIASGIPPHREIAGNTVFWFDPGNFENLAVVMLRFLENQGEFSPEQGFRRAEKFRWNDSALKLAQLYAEL
jgi:glycosyltransferase involved in cell wall biosynthesis